MKRTMRHLCIALFILASGCTPESCTPERGQESKPPVSIPANDSLKAFASEQEMTGYIKNQFASSVFFYEETDDGGVTTMASADSGGMNTSQESAVSSSITNIQEEGVDESDMVKTDGTYIYTAGDREVTIVKTSTSRKMERTSVIDVKGYPDSIYLNKNILTVLYIPFEKYWYSPHLNTSPSSLTYSGSVLSSTGVMFVDISDPKAPSVIMEMQIDGSLVSSRVTGGRLYLVQQFCPVLPPLNTYCEWSDDGLDKARSDNMSRLFSLEPDDMVPHYRFIRGDQDTSNRQLLEPCNTYHPSIGAGGNIVTVTSFNFDDLSAGLKSLGIVADAQVVYASKNNIYLSNILWDRNSPYYTGELYDNQRMSIYKIAIGDDGIKAAGAGMVNGWILNQFSLGESDGVLRIATTDTSSGKPVNAVYCLREEAGELKTIGSIEDITPGERLYSARFVGDRGYLVTFVKVDPLIALDLSDPKKPEIKGELILPGYSTYIHPLNDGYLLTVGRDTTDSGYGFAWYQGIQLTIFDVRDMSKPKVAHQLIAGDRNTQAEALSNHKAITFMADRGILAFHMNSGYGTSATGSKESLDINESGLYVFGVSVGKGFNFMSDIPDEGYSDRTRGVIIGDSIYSVSSYSIGAAALSNLDGDISRIILDTPYECIDGISCSETVEGLE